MLATPIEDTDPDIPRVTVGPDLSVIYLQFQVAVDQLTKPERITLEREDDEQVARTLANLRADYAAARAHATDLTRSQVERNAHLRRASRIARDIIATARARIELPPLLAQIREAVESSTSSGQVGNAAHPAPIGLAAAALLGEIEAVVGRGDPTLVPQVRRWAASAGAWRTTSPERLFEVNRLAQEWVTACRGLLNPERRYRAVRDAQCPACGRSHAFTVVEGERRREPALLLDSQTGWTTCRACTERWAPEQGLWLARVLEQQRAERRARRQG